MSHRAPATVRTVIKRKSGLQLEVLRLYRNFFKAIRTKAPEARPGFADLVRNEFRQNQDISRANVQRIEYLLRRGGRQLEALKSPNVTKAQ